MSARLLVGLTTALALLAFGSPVVPAAEPEKAPSRQAIEEIVRDYILKHPEVLLESIRKMEERQREAQRQQARKAIAAHRSALLNDPGSPVGGNPRGNVTVVEFFDYRCPHCKRVVPTVKKLLQDDPNVRFVYKEFPILGEDSLLAAKAALASRAQGKYVAFHNALMAAKESLNEAQVMKIAAGVGLDGARLKADMNKPETLAVIKGNYALAQALGIEGTPAFVIGTELVPGAASLEVLKELVAKARSK